jgi:hypothetical protein
MNIRDGGASHSAIAGRRRKIKREEIHEQEEIA